MRSHNYQDLIYLFNLLFEESEKTILVSHGTEPLYLPCDSDFSLNRIIFTHDYFASALHEIAHWCIASKERRTQIDYGYWYNPDGRNAEQQALFEQVEVKPQALEWIFSTAAGSTFTVSADNLSGGDNRNEAFEKKIIQQMQHYLTVGLPKRAELFKNELLIFYQTSG
jgi:elongation factor P hydroxylase